MQLTPFPTIFHFFLLSAIIFYSIFLVNSIKIERFWTAFPENKANQIVTQIEVDFEVEKRKLYFYFSVNKAENLFNPKYSFNMEYENEEKLTLWNGEKGNIAGGNVREIDLNSQRGFTIKLDEFGILDGGNFELKIAAEFKEMVRKSRYGRPDKFKPTGRVKRQLFKLVRNAGHFAILDDFPAEGETEASSSSSLHSNKMPQIESIKGMELLNWIPADLRQIGVQNKQLTESRPNLKNAKYFNFAYIGTFKPKEALAQSAASFLQFFIYAKEAEGFFIENMQIRICKRGDWNPLTKDCGLQVHRAQFVPSQVKYLAKCGIRFELERGENKNLHLYIILEGGNNEYGIKEVLELETDSLGDNVLMLERPNAESKWKPSSSAPGTSSNADSTLVSSLTVKHFFVEDLLIFEYSFAHDVTTTEGYGSLTIHHKQIVYCSEEKWNRIAQNCQGGNGQQVEIMNKRDETKSTYRLSAEQIQLSLLKEAIRIFVRIETSARPNAVQVLEVAFYRRENKIKISQLGAEGGECQILK